MLATSQDVNHRMDRYKWVLVQTGYAELRTKLINDGIIKDYVFMVDQEFSSVSAAAAVILGRAANGRREWTKLDGQTYAQAGN